MFTRLRKKKTYLEVRAYLVSYADKNEREQRDN